MYLNFFYLSVVFTAILNSLFIVVIALQDAISPDIAWFDRVAEPLTLTGVLLFGLWLAYKQMKKMHEDSEAKNNKLIEVYTDENRYLKEELNELHKLVDEVHALREDIQKLKKTI